MYFKKENVLEEKQEFLRNQISRLGYNEAIDLLLDNKFFRIQENEAGFYLF